MVMRGDCRSFFEDRIDVVRIRSGWKINITKS